MIYNSLKKKKLKILNYMYLLLTYGNLLTCFNCVLQEWNYRKKTLIIID